jgi:integrase
LEAAGKIETAHRVRSTLRRVLRFAMARGQISFNPMEPLADALGPAIVRHMPTILDHKRIGRLIFDLKSYGGGPVVRSAALM